MQNSPKSNFTEAQTRLMSLLGKDFISEQDTYWERRRKLQKRPANPATSRNSLRTPSGVKPLSRFS